MVTLWMRSKIDGTYDGERSVTTVPQGIAENLVGNLNAEFADMGLPLRVYLEEG